MDFSYFDKPEYRSIELFDDGHLNSISKGIGYQIRKYRAADEEKELHRHMYVQINYVYKGRGSHIVNKKKVDIFKGDIFVVPPYVPHLIAPADAENLEIFEFEFSTDFILPYGIGEDTAGCLDFAYLEPFMVAEEEIKPRFNLSEKLQNEVEAILNEVQKEDTDKNPGYALVVKALLLKLLVITGRAYSREIRGTETEEILNKYKKVISYSIEYINKNYSENITLKEVALAVNYSQSHFSYLFKAITGKTFVEYLNEVRIKKSIELLKDSDMRIIDVSCEVGFNTISNFNKTFKAVTGLTPRSYRRTIEQRLHQE